MLVTDPHGQKKWPASSAVVFVIAGPWRQTLGDTHRALSLTSSEQCYFLGFRVKVKKIKYFCGFFTHLPVSSRRYLDLPSAPRLQWKKP